MSIAATNWAYRQKIPIKPKFVLAALADQADERTGRVCYGKTDMKYLAEKCSIPERSLYRYIGALIKNGYVVRESGKTLGQPSVYWLSFDRAEAESLGEWLWKTADDYDHTETQDVGGGSAKMAEGQTTENPVKMAEGVCQSMAEGVCHKVADIEPTSIPKNSTRKRAKNDFSFSRKEQDAERRALAAEEETRKANARVFVLEGSRAWNAWIEHRRKSGLIGSLPSCKGSGEHAGRRGWYLPSLFPPPAAPAEKSSLSNEDLHEFTK